MRERERKINRESQLCFEVMFALTMSAYDEEGKLDTVIARQILEAAWEKVNESGLAGENQSENELLQSVKMANAILAYGSGITVELLGQDIDLSEEEKTWIAAELDGWEEKKWVNKTGISENGDEFAVANENALRRGVLKKLADTWRKD
jgi:hypothetical protein